MLAVISRSVRLVWVSCALAFAALLTSGCGSTGVQNAELAKKSIPKGKARLQIRRTDEVLYAAGAATVKLNGKQVADLGNGAAAILVVPAGTHTLTTYGAGTPGEFRVKLNARAGRDYVVEISPRTANFVATAAFGLVGSIVDAVVNENGGAYQMVIK